MAESDVPFGGKLGIGIDDYGSRHSELCRKTASGWNQRAGLQLPVVHGTANLSFDLRSELFAGTV
ncbi:MAG: hypothetical protein ABI884_08015 [Gemmatimonadota bacterium]